MKGSKKQSQNPELGVPGVDLGQLERLLSFMAEYGLEEFEYAHGDLRIRLKKAVAQGAAPLLRALPTAPEAPAPGAAAPAPPQPPAPAAAAGAKPARTRGCRGARYQIAHRRHVLCRAKP